MPLPRASYYIFHGLCPCGAYHHGASAKLTLVMLWLPAQVLSKEISLPAGAIEEGRS